MEFLFLADANRRGIFRTCEVNSWCHPDFMRALLLFISVALLFLVRGVAAGGDHHDNYWQANCTQNCTVNFIAPVVAECDPLNCSIVCENGDPEDYCHDRCETLDSCRIRCNLDNCTAVTPECEVKCHEDLECDAEGDCRIDCAPLECGFVIAPGAPIAVPVCDEPVCSTIYCEEETATGAATRGFSLF